MSIEDFAATITRLRPALLDPSHRPTQSIIELLAAADALIAEHRQATAEPRRAAA